LVMGRMILRILGQCWTYSRTAKETYRSTRIERYRMAKILSPKMKLLFLTIFIAFVLSLLLHFTNTQFPFGGFYIQALLFIMIAIAIYVLLTRTPRN
jgi:hypothetical protein